MSALKYPEPDLDALRPQGRRPRGRTNHPRRPSAGAACSVCPLPLPAACLLGALLAVVLLRPGTGPLAAGPAGPPPEVAGFAESYVHTFIASRAPGNEQVLAPYTPAEVEWSGGALGDRHVVDTTTVGFEQAGDDEWRVEVAAHVMDFDRERDGYRRPGGGALRGGCDQGRWRAHQPLPPRTDSHLGSSPRPGLAPVLEKAGSGEIAAAAKEYLDAHYAAIGGYTGFTMVGIAVEPSGEDRSRVIVRVRAKPVDGASVIHDHVLEAVSGEDGWVVGIIPRAAAGPGDAKVSSVTILGPPWRRRRTRLRSLSPRAPTGRRRRRADRAASAPGPATGAPWATHLRP